MAGLRLEIEPALAEEAVFLALRGRADERMFRRERDPLYSIAEPEQREAAFGALHARWFAQLDLGRPVALALAGEERIGREVSAAFLRRARRLEEEGVELLVRSNDRDGRVMRILLRPGSFLSPGLLLDRMREEFLHVSDMLDPRFGYAPSLAASDETEIPAKLLLDRYSVVWNASVAGRLERRGHSAPGTRARAWSAFQRTFPMLGDQAAASAFARFCLSEAPTHLELMAFARDPREVLLAVGGGEERGSWEVNEHSGRCALCRLPTYALLPHPDALPEPVLAAIARDFPAWEPAAGLCGQCADLYAARAAEPASS
jgi:hypothetical protein